MSKKAKSTKAVQKKNMTKKIVSQKLQVVKKAYSKSQLVRHIAETTELSKKKVAEVLEVLDNVICAHLHKGSIGTLNFLGLVKFKSKQMPAQKARKGRNPFTGEEIMLKAKPARNIVKIKPLQRLKDKIV